MLNQSGMPFRQWLFQRSMLVSIAASFEAGSRPLELIASVIDRWEENSWPAVHFFPEALQSMNVGNASYGKLVRPGACRFEASTISPWSVKRFRALHHDLGLPHIIVVGGDLERSVLATAIGGAERNILVAVVAETTANRLVDDAARLSAVRILRQFAVEATACEILQAAQRTPKPLAPKLERDHRLFQNNPPENATGELRYKAFRIRYHRAKQWFAEIYPPDLDLPWTVIPTATLDEGLNKLLQIAYALIDQKLS